MVFDSSVPDPSSADTAEASAARQTPAERTRSSWPSRARQLQQSTYSVLFAFFINFSETKLNLKPSKQASTASNLPRTAACAMPNQRRRAIKGRVEYYYRSLQVERAPGLVGAYGGFTSKVM